MTPRLFALALMVHLLAWCGYAVQHLGAGDQPAALAQDAADVQDLVFLGPNRPVLVRLHVYLDGKPFRTAYREAWADHVTKLFAFLDRDGDGRLSKAEAERMPPPQMFLAAGIPGLSNSPINVAFNFSVVDADGDGWVSPTELADYYREQSDAPFVTQFAPRPVSPSVNIDLFRRLDLNRDGKLDREEIAGAIKTLMALDLDDDELITAVELNPNLAPDRQVPNVPGTGTPTPPPERLLLTAYPGEEGWLAEGIMARYGRTGVPPRLKTLSPAEIGLTQEEFARLDTDGDGKLSVGEMVRIRELTPHLEVKLAFGRGTDGAGTLEVLGANPLNAIKTTAGSLLVPLPGVRLELIQNQGPPLRLPDGKAAYLQHFQELDVNHDGQLSRTEAQPSPFFGKLFALLDRNDDKMVSLKETEEYLDQVQEAQFLAMASRVHLLKSQPGVGLFDLLDRNQDGRLSLREIRELPSLGKTLDGDGDGFVTRDEIPTVYRLAMGLSQASFNRYGGNLIQMPPQVPNLGVPDLLRGGPLWFRKMDRNRDGDVSRREFLGTKEEFDKLDADGDGLISAEEAVRARRQK